MTETLSGDILAPSGKGARDENFPVASWLIASAHRPHIMAFYRFARSADDIADSPALTPREKLRRLDRFAEALRDRHPSAPAPALRHAESLAATGISPEHALQLLSAFRQDAEKNRYASWAELSHYCSLSAWPVGRYVLQLHGEGPETWTASDALTAALQVLNHCQDIREDFTSIDRVYLPGDWLAANGVAEAELGGTACSPGLRRVIDLCLDACDAWLRDARALPRLIRNRRLAAEVAVIWRLATRLSRRLRHDDPIAGPVPLRPADWAFATTAGALRLARI